MKTVNLGGVTQIGNEAFLNCTSLVNIDLSNVTSLGAYAFRECSALRSVTLGEGITRIENYTFYGCSRLTTIDLSNVTYIGYAAFYVAPLYKTLNLDKIEVLGDMAFYNGGTLLVETLNAPNLREVGEQVFTGSKLLKVVNAPKIEKIGYAAFANTSITEFEVSESLTSFDTNVFENCEKFKYFYAIVDGEKVTTADLGNVRIEDGVLYSKVSTGYILECYPQGKTETSLKVLNGTIRIEYCAAYKNLSLETVELPESLRYIGDHAFDACENLKSVKFNSYYAPVLEGTWSGVHQNITPENKEDFIAFNELYGRNYYYYTTNKISFADLYHYSTFKGEIGTKLTEGLICIIPENSYGYDSHMYSVYFDVSEEDTSGIVMGSYAIAFVNAVNKLPEVATRFDSAIVSAAIDAYNALVEREDELAFVDDALIEKFNQARSEYYVDVAEGLIAKLFGMYNNEYCFNLVKEARASYLALSEEEKALVSNGAILGEKITALTAAMGIEPDFTKTYSEHFATDEPVVDNPGENNPTDDNNNNGGTLTIILIGVGAVVVLAGAAVALVLVKKNKAAVATEAGDTTAATEETAAQETVEETTDDTTTEVEDN